MAVTKKLLKGIGLTDDQIESVFEAHMETVTDLKREADGLREKADKAEALQKQIDAAAGGKDWKAEHDKVKGEFEKFKADAQAKEAADRVKAAYRGLLRENKVGEKFLDSVMRATDFKDMKLDAEGKLENADKLSESIKSDWGDFIVHADRQGSGAKDPPAGSGATKTREEIMAIKDTKERQQAIAENHEAFGF